jgi:putative restriction endonuclease
MLGIIQDYCLYERLPPLTAIVITKQHKTPGVGFIAGDVSDLDNVFATVYSVQWSAMPNPFAQLDPDDTVKSLAEEVVENPDSAHDVFRKVRARGLAQQVFREVLIEAYDGKCAVCGLSFVKALQAHHIIPFYQCTPEQKIAAHNGILLCANHHRFVEEKYISIASDFTLSYYDPELADGDYTKSDKLASVAWHGKKLAVPDDPRLRPRLPEK